MKAEKIIETLKNNPEAYIIDWAVDNTDCYQIIFNDEPEDNIEISKSKFTTLLNNKLIAWQPDSDQWGDRYRLKTI